jgi:hypothetical protein
MRKLRTWWINEREWKRLPKACVDKIVLSLKWDMWFKKENGALIRTTKPKNIAGWICVTETKVRRNK